MQIISKLEPSEQHYALVVIGSGVHALATAYYLARQHDITSMAVISGGYFGADDSAITSLPRLDYSHHGLQLIRQHSGKLTQSLIEEHRGLISLSQRDALSLATEPACSAYLRSFSLLSQRAGADCTLVRGASSVSQLCPLLASANTAELTAVRQQQVSWLQLDGLLKAYALALYAHRVELIENCPLQRLSPATSAAPVRLRVGDQQISADKVACCSSNDALALAQLLNMPLKLQRRPWRVCASASAAPWLAPLLYSPRLQAWCGQNNAGEFIFASPAEHSYQALGFFAGLIPALSTVRLDSIIDSTLESSADGAPLMALNISPGISLSCAWGFASDLIPAMGELFAHSLVADQLHPLCNHLSFDRE